MNCKNSPSKNHQYYPDQNWRDDSGFYLKCAFCTHVEFFEVDTEDELMDLFGLKDDDEYDYFGDSDDDYDYED